MSVTPLATDPGARAPGSSPGPSPGPPADQRAEATVDAAQRHALRRMKLLATGLLVAVALVFLVARRFESTAAGYVEAFAEAAMIGALADWFAVTALFRHPLGVPIPHTAIIAERKDDIGRGLGRFVQGNFLSGPVIAEKIRSVGVADRIGQYLADPVNARKLGENAGDAVQAAMEVLRDEDIAPTVEQMVRGRVAEVAAAPLAAKVLEAALAEGHHQQVIESLLHATTTFLDRNHDTIRRRVTSESPWWVPGSVDDRIVNRLTSGGRNLLEEVSGDPSHDVRLQIDERLREWTVRLRTSPEMEARGEEIKAQLLDHPALRSWTASLWGDLKATLIASAEDPASDLRARLEEGIVRLGETLRTDADLRIKLEEWVERTVVYLLEQYRSEVADLIAGTVARWDADDASRRIELQVGRDLQFIRINGTVVGGLVGVILHALGPIL